MTTDLKFVLVTREVRARLLRRSYASAGLAAFRLRESGQSYDYFAREEAETAEAVSTVLRLLQNAGHVQVLDRGLLPTHRFHAEDVVVVVGQDGLVANTLRYTPGLAVIGVNPRPQTYEGTLLPFTPKTLPEALAGVAGGRALVAQITMAEARFSDGRRLVAANDLFFGRLDPASALYRIGYGGEEERHSSSGVIVSTPLGSTAWQRSVVTGAVAIVNALGSNVRIKPKAVAWDEDRLRFWTREPWPSVASSARVVAGIIRTGQELVLSSEMGEGGAAFADGMHADAVPFLAGDVVRVVPAKLPGKLVVAHPPDTTRIKPTRTPA